MTPTRSLAVVLGLVLTVLTAGCGQRSQPSATVSVVNVTDTVAFERDVTALGGLVVMLDIRASIGQARFPEDRAEQAQHELTALGYVVVTPAPLPTPPDNPSAPA